MKHLLVGFSLGSAFQALTLATLVELHVVDPSLDRLWDTGWISTIFACVVVLASLLIGGSNDRLHKA